MYGMLAAFVDDISTQNVRKTLLKYPYSLRSKRIQHEQGNLLQISLNNERITEVSN
jgi:hypothetical protein